MQTLRIILILRRLLGVGGCYVGGPRDSGGVGLVLVVLLLLLGQL